jgi:YD repeat-containing protein
MQLRKETYSEIDNFLCDFEKEYYKNGLLKSEYRVGSLEEFEYNENGKLLSKTTNDFSGDIQIFYKKEFLYNGNTTRIFEYRTGHTDLKDRYVYDHLFTNLGKLLEGPMPIYPLNELLSIEEFVYNSKGERILEKKINLENNSISEIKMSYDLSGNLINRVFHETNQSEKHSNYSYNYNEGVLESILVNSKTITYYKYNEDGKVIEIDCYEIIDEIESFYSKTSLDYENDRIVNIIFKSSPESSFGKDNDLGFGSWKNEFIKWDKTILGMKLFIDFSEYYQRKNYEIKIEYEYDQIKQTTFIYTGGDFKREFDSNGIEDFIFYENVVIEENKFFVYKYNERIKIDIPSTNKYIKNHPIENIDGFTIKDNKIIHLFSYKFEYFIDS